MGYYITITECNLEYTDPNHSPLNPADFFYAWYNEEEDVLPEDWYIKWTNNLINDFHHMIKQGIHGTIEIRGEEGEYTLFRLTKDVVNEYYALMSYSNDPDVVHKNTVKEVSE
ncbi:MAG: hypothetical protein U9N61_00195 [Euryarchaeota archaeon]|nr:hypothetical protein [Euryarchaeota archaeon]